ncbi:MAG: amino terminal protease [Amycolatopsis sp.]|nr:amino terminal protease [Amycolatopsis sp.]
MVLPDTLSDNRSSLTGVRGLISRHPLPSFFILAFVLSWFAWTPYILSKNGVGLLPFGYPTAMGSTQLTGVLPGAYLGPILAAFIVTAVAEGRPGLRLWAGRLLKWRVNWRWYVAIILGVPATLILTSFPIYGVHLQLPAATVLVAYLPALVFQMLTTGLAEEPGWRDFALPHLQPRFGPLRGTLILGTLWGAWHLPLFLTDWAGPDVSWYAPIEFVATAIVFSLVMTWVFNRTGQSLPLAMLLHTSVNNFFSVAWTAVFPGAQQDTASHILLISSTVAAAILLIATRGKLGYRGPR